MTRRSGRNGVIYADVSATANAAASPVNFIGKWSISQSTDKAEVSAMGDSNKVHVVGLPDASGSLDGFVDMGTSTFANLTNSAYGARKMYLYPDAVNHPTVYFYGSMFFDGSYSGDLGSGLSVSLTLASGGSCYWTTGI